MNRYAGNSFFGGLPPVILNLIIINGLFFLATIAGQNLGLDLSEFLGMFYFDSIHFKPLQIITHMFMHGSFMHIFFNMFALFMFGPPLERLWGPQRFLIYYFVTGFGAFILHYGVIHFQIQELLPLVSSESLEQIKYEGRDILLSGRNFVDPNTAQLNLFYNIPVVGASGAVFGLLLAFGMMFPDVRLMLLFFPVPIKAKYFVMGYGALELLQGLNNNPGDNVAHFAHIGGMVFGYFLIKLWRNRSTNHFH